MVVSSILMLAGLGFVAAVVLAVASKVFYVEEDPKVEAVIDALPGANCGGCGYAGCEGYAIAVVNLPNVAANLCVAGGPEISINVGELTGKVVTESEPLISFRRCDKVAGRVQKRYTYQGMPSCAAAATLAQGADVCPHSCLGFGDCEIMCPFDALYIENDIVMVRENLCTGCGMCVHACPREILELIPRRSRVTIMCSTRDKLRAVMDVCEAGCIQCGKCIKNCPARAISIKESRVCIDQIKCLAYGPDCEEVCVAGCPRFILRSSTPKACTCGEPGCEPCETEKPPNESLDKVSSESSDATPKKASEA